jgi:murein DD-endopeptidase MepM/ murein hydrolase activator NlpD
MEKEKAEKEQEAEKEKQEEAPPFITPAEGRLTSEFGYRTHPIHGDRRFHQGIDIAEKGKVEILASADGVVTKSQVLGTYGQVVMIEHEIDGEIYETVYAHLRDNSRKVSVGDKVEQGQVIGLKGSTGNSTGQHLHFEIHEGKWEQGQPNAVDPLEYIEVG